MKTIVNVISLLLLTLFVYVGVSKIMEYNTFKLQMSKAPFISSYAGILSYCVPVIELLTAALLTFQKTRLIGLYFSLFLMSLFSGYIYLMLEYSYDLPCSCGGIISSLSWGQHLVMNIALTVLSVFAIIMEGKMGAINSINSNPSIGAKPQIKYILVLFVSIGTACKVSGFQLQENTYWVSMEHPMDILTFDDAVQECGGDLLLCALEFYSFGAITGQVLLKP